jgi:hypothetical protein
VILKPGTTAKQLRKMSDEELAEFWSGWKPHTPDYFMAEMEVRRRQSAPTELRGWISLTLSVVAIVISVIALVLKGW